MSNANSETVTAATPPASQPKNVDLHRVDGRQQCEHFYGTHTDRQCVLPARYHLELEDGSARQYCRQHYEAHMPPIAERSHAAPGFG